MDASVVIGQTDFTSFLTNTTTSGFNLPTGVASDGTRLIISDESNNRVLIWNSIPTTNGAPADVVIGQTNLTSGSVNQGGSANANTLSSPLGVETDGTRLFIADKLNARVLIYNHIPTSNNASADIVIGQPDFITTSAAISATKFTFPSGIDFDPETGKLAITDQFTNSGTGAGRVLIYNSVPMVNGAPADVVIGQTNFTSGSAGACPAATASNICPSLGSARIIQSKLLLADFNYNRVLIWNSIPTTNGASADLVIGQADFTHSAFNQGATNPAANTMRGPVDTLFDGRRLFITDSVNNSRILIFDGIPSTNNASANTVIGQPTLSAMGTNQNASTPIINGLGRPRYMALVDDKLIVADRTNNRVLIFPNLVRGPGLSLAGSPTRQYDNIFRQFGTAVSDPLYVIHSVEYSVNGGSFSSAVPTDGVFDGTREDFHLDFDPGTTSPYTLRLRSFNNNVDVTDHLFYFSPFDLLTPVQNGVVSTATPTFTFSVNKQREALRDNLVKYQLLVKKDNLSWQTIIENLPVDFATHKGDTDNLQASTYTGLSTNNGTYETRDFKAVYTNDSSTVAVTSKNTPLSGTYTWKIQAVDPAGHIQSTEERRIHVQAPGLFSTSIPLTLSNISGVGNPHLSSFIPFTMQNSFLTSNTHPTFTGITYTGSTVALEITNTITNITKTYTSIASNSRFSITVPKGDLLRGINYQAVLSSTLGDKYAQVPMFMIRVRQ
ncbi:MAG TPA: hypothetical protein VLH19_00785 [Patescibacteria group bacterium]|nr:hypothetical protein [Patescibacteria group bacterium]